MPETCPRCGKLRQCSCDSERPMWQAPPIGLPKLSPQLAFQIVAMVDLGGRLFVASEHHVYELVDGIFQPCVFRTDAEDEALKNPRAGDGAGGGDV